MNPLAASREAFTPEIFSELNALYQAGRFFDAYQRTLALPPLAEWPTVDAVVLAGRLVSNWGDSALSNRLHQRAYRRDPANLEAIYFHGLSTMHRHGLFAGLMFLRPKLALLDGAAPSPRLAHLWLLQARLLGWYRDFGAAGEWVARAEAVLENDAWLWVEKACLFERQDRYEEGLVAARRALEIRPWYRPAVETAAHALQLLNRDDESLGLLQAASDHLQCGGVLQMLAVQLAERERFEEALDAVDRAERLHPLADRGQKQWSAARRAEALYRLGRYAGAREQALLADNGYHRHVAERLASVPEAGARRVLLPVGFVRQHHMTCAPATLAAIGAFWGKAVDHLELARVICYDGTPDHEERYWAEKHGWCVREFRVTWETAVALIDRGCPFTLTTVATRSAHLQAVVGYDAVLEMLLIRDPYHRLHGEFIAKAFLETQAANGPRGMVLLPADQAHRLEGVPLLDAELFDRWYALRRALAVHDGGGAEEQAQALATQAPGHRLAHLARRQLAGHHGNPGQSLEELRALRSAFPGEVNFQLEEIQTLQQLGRRAEARELLRQLATKPGADPVFWRDWVEELRSDARNHPRAGRLIWRVLRRQSVDANALRTHANLQWDRRDFAGAVFVYRLAATAGDKVEHHWSAWFAASRHVQAAEQSLAILRERCERLGASSGQPARTLFASYEALDRGDEAFGALERALEMRPGDGELLLFAAEAHGRHGRSEQADRLLSRAEGRASRAMWLRTAAQLAGYRTKHDEALKFWRDYIETSPPDPDAHRQIARLTSLLEGRVAALAFLADSCARHPHNVPLLTLRLEWLRAETPEQALPAVDALLALDAAGAWALREKAGIFRQLGRFDEARGLAEEALRIEPGSPYSHGTLGQVLIAAGKPVEARLALREGLKLSIDAVWLFGDLVGTSADFAERREAVFFLHGELLRQPVFEDAALRFREVARGILPPDELMSALRLLREKYPGTWTTWSALSRHLIDHGKVEEARENAAEAVRRFPMVPLLRLDLAAVHGRAGRSEEEVACLQHALELSPAWGLASRQLALAHERALHLEAAEHVLRRAIAANPLDAASCARLAEVVFRRGRQDEARELVERAIHLEPGYDPAWQLLHGWNAGRAGGLVELAGRLTKERPGDTGSWIRVARYPGGKGGLDERLAALDRALVLEARNLEAHDFRAELLGGHGRFEEALAACAPAAYDGRLPRELLGRAAWIEVERGNLPRAIERMQAVVDAHPDYAWGWARLAEWVWQNNDAQKTVDAATKWSWLDPDSSIALGYVAVAQLQLKNRGAAKEALQRALHVDPSYSFGAQRLLQLHAEDAEVEMAARILDHIRVHLSPMEARRADVRWHVLRRARAAARDALAAMSACPAGETGALREAAGAMFEAGWAREVEEAFEAALGDVASHAEVGGLWARGWIHGQRWSRIRLLKKKGATEAVSRSAYGELIEGLGKRRERWRLRWLRWTRGAWLRADVETWGSMGNALVHTDEPRAGARWLGDWRGRTGIKPWMLHNLAQAYYARGKARRAAEVVGAVIEMPADHTRSGFLAWHALELALGGETDRVRAVEVLAASAAGQLSPYMNTVRQLAEILISFQRSHREGDTSALAGAKIYLAELKADYPGLGTDAALRRFGVRVLRSMAADAGSWWTYAQTLMSLEGVAASAERKKESAGPAVWLIVVVMVVLRACLAAG